jgi:hypothetical protein
MKQVHNSPYFFFNCGIYFGNPKIYQQTTITTTMGSEDIKEEGICLETDSDDQSPDEPIVRQLYKNQ